MKLFTSAIPRLIKRLSQLAFVCVFLATPARSIGESDLWERSGVNFSVEDGTVASACEYVASRYHVALCAEFSSEVAGKTMNLDVSAADRLGDVLKRVATQLGAYIVEFKPDGIVSLRPETSKDSDYPLNRIVTSLDVTNAPLRDVHARLVGSGLIKDRVVLGMSSATGPFVSKRVALSITNAPLRSVLNQIVLQSGGCSWQAETHGAECYVTFLLTDPNQILRK